MSTTSAKPVIFISYSHKDEPKNPGPKDECWLTFVQSHLQPAVKHGIYDLWVDEDIPGGGTWRAEITRKLDECDVCVLLVSRHSLASDFIIDVEIEALRKRRNKGEADIFPIVLTPCAVKTAPWIKEINLRPPNGQPLSDFEENERHKQMAAIAEEIAGIALYIAEKKKTTQAMATILQLDAPPTIRLIPLPPTIHTGTADQPGEIDAGHRGYIVFDTSHLPETAYERLVGREAELKLLDDAWADTKTNILSLVAEGGAGKSVLVNEWLKRLQADNYHGAEAVLGWSFYSQGTKERATSAEEFLNWALGKLGIKITTTSASAKAEAIAEAMMRHRVLLLLDGVEPLQHGLDMQLGQLKDLGLRALLRRFAATPPGKAHGLVVLTSRLAIKDIEHWRDGPAPVIDVERLSDEASAALLRDNGVWGTDRDLKAAAQDFSGHPLALDLLASYLKETQFGDVRRRDHIRAFFADPDNPRHDHAKRVMESYEKEWLAGQPVLLAIMQMVGLFDRPANENCLNALRDKPIIEGLTDSIVGLSGDDWNRAVFRLRTVRLLAPMDASSPKALDAHPLVRDWFAERLEKRNDKAWRSSHGRLFDYLKNNTWESHEPTLEELGPLYQAIVHGCRAGRSDETLKKIYWARICRRRTDYSLEFYSQRKLGAFSSDLAAISRFFRKPYEILLQTLNNQSDRAGVLSVAAFCLRAQGRLTEGLAAQRATIRLAQETPARLRSAARRPLQIHATNFANLSETELALGEVEPAIVSGTDAVKYADLTDHKGEMLRKRMILANAVDAAGQREQADRLAVEAQHLQRAYQPEYPLLNSLQGYWYCDLLIARSDWNAACHHATQTQKWHNARREILPIALGLLAESRAHLGLALSAHSQSALPTNCNAALNIRAWLDEAIEGLRSANQALSIPRGLLVRAAFRRCVGDWDGAARDLDEVAEIAEPGPMRLHLCDMALERTRLAFARGEAFAPLNGLILKLERPGEAERRNLHNGAAKQLAIAADYIEKCGYHRRDEEFAELQAVLKGEKTFAELPPRV